MKAVVVYESIFGNTKEVAERIAEGLRSAGDVAFGSTDEIPPARAHDADLIVAGGPTHAHSMARRNAHEEVAQNKAMKKYGPIVPGELSLREWIEQLPEGGASVATFDTRFDKPKWLTGSAAKKIAGRFGEKGYAVVGEESFFVEKTGGPLAEGERERAVEWGRSLASLARQATPV